MANQEHLALLMQGRDAWNKWRQEHPEIQPDLTKANLVGADLGMIDFSRTNLVKANLSRANLVMANFHEADLKDANLWGAVLKLAHLSNADLSNACLRDTELEAANFTNANLCGAYLNGATLVRTILENTKLTGCFIHGISVWDVELQGAIQGNLIITELGQPPIMVENIELAQFIYLLLTQKKLRDVLNSVIERSVLLLGRFDDGGLATLQAIAAKLREEQYLPIIFDFERPKNRDLTETVITLAGLSRFVIVDLSGPSVPNELHATIPNFKIPFVPLIEEGKKVFSMFTDFLGNPWVLPLVTFSSQEQLIELLPSMVIGPAEEKFKKRQELLHQLFNR